MVSTCRWCTSVEPGASDLLPNYCSGLLSAEDEQAANDDLSFCLECVVEYHKARDEQPSLHERLWERETSRLLARFTQLSEEELEDDDLFLIQDDQEIQVPKFTAAQYENLLRVPIIEMLMYPYLMGHSKLSQMLADALCKMENSNSLSIPDKYQGIYVLLVHPNETVRRWAIRAARFLGKVDRDDFYDLQDIFISMFSVIELDIFHDCDIDTSYNPKESKIGLLPRHLYDSTNYKTYWLGLTMLLNVLDAQAMDSLLLGPDKQIDIMQCILNTMEKAVEDETMDPFWPALQCFMVILDCLGSKVWGQIEPASAFHAITGSPSYAAQIENIRSKAIMPKVKAEMPCDEDMVTCSQMVYESNFKDERKGSRFGRSTNTESSSKMFEKMRSLVSVLQLDVGKAMRVHGSTFLWFFPYVESVMGLDDLSIVYIGEIIHYLCGEIKDLVNGRKQTCDKVTEYFTQILVFVIKLHLDKSCMNVLYYSMSNWVEVIVKCATLPWTAFPSSVDSGSSHVSSTTSLMALHQTSQVRTGVPQACMNVIRSLLKEGGRYTSNSKSVQFLDILNKKIRVVSKEWSLAVTEVKELQNCLKQAVKLLKDNRLVQATDRNVDALRPPPISSSADPCNTENCGQPLKCEQRLDIGHCSSKVAETTDGVPMKRRESDILFIKKEPNLTQENYEAISESKPCPEPTRMTPDPGKLKELKSKVSPSLFCKLQDIAKKPADLKDVKVEMSSEQCTVETFPEEAPCSSVIRCQEGPQAERPLTSVSERIGSGTQSAQSMSDECEYGDDVPLSAVKGFLKKSQLKSPEGKTHFKFDSSPQYPGAASSRGPNGASDFGQAEVSDVTRGMEQKGRNKDHGQHLKIVESEPDVIVISDSESAKEDDEILGCRRKVGRFQNEKLNIKSEPCSETDYQKSPVFDLTEADSQMFEFETQEDVFSAWSDCAISSNVPVQENEKELPSASELSDDPGPSDLTTALGYDTEPISDDIIEHALFEAEERLKGQNNSVQPQVRNAEKTDYFVKPTELPSKASGKGTLCIKRKEGEGNIDKNAQSRRDEQKEKTYHKETSSKFASKPSTSSFASPAIVPPKKVRKPVEPTSTVEKLGLKKKERKAFDLSQRSLDCVEQLRKHGQGVQVEQKKPTRRRKSKLTSPQKLNVKGHKKLLASQERQFFRQSREKKQSLQRMTSSELTNSKSSPDPQRKTNSKRSTMQKTTVVEDERDNDDLFFLSSLAPDSVVTCSEREKKVDQKTKSGGSTMELSSNENKRICSTTAHVEPLPSTRHAFHRGTEDDSRNCAAAEVNQEHGLGDGEENAHANLTQRDPVDMEICSEIEDDLFLTQRDPVDMDVDSDDQTSPENSRWMDQHKEGQGRVVIPQMTSVGQKRYCTPQEDDKIFLKPGMSPVSCKKAKPSTTKIYAPSSRSATLVQEMEKTTKPPPPTAKHKFVRPALPVRKSVPQKESSLPSPMDHAAPVPIGASGSAPHVPSYKTYARPETPISDMARIDSGFKFDHSILINTVLSWTFEMFCSFSQFGVPSDLCSLPLQEVTNSYKSYEEYFKTFFPLLLINTFEELAKDWEKKHSRQITHQLKAIGPEYGSEIDSISFTACLSDRDVQHQLYPKEDDLVILWLPQNRNVYASNEPELMEPSAYFGCVSRSTLNLADERPTLNLTIQTRGNVSLVDNQFVKCQLVGSLVSAIRAFRALCMLKNSGMMFWPILAPQVSFFQPSQENIIVVSLPEYNAEQLKAIKWGISIVRRQQVKPKICLIHGPPGTGKSKTIAGLLQSLFSEQNLAVPVGRNGKASRLRVLLCAPSNAAIDNLMKKVILIFKENCRDIQNPLGNCGDINLVRLGNEKTISRNLIPFSLDSQTRARTQKAQQGHDMNKDRCKQQLDQQIDHLSKMCAMVKKDPDKFRQLTEHKSKLLKEREQLGRQLRAARSRKQETQAKVLQDAHIICSTLSTSGGMILESAFRRLGHEPFNCIIVDEAGQATEPETLIPLRFRCPSLILVGDPEQLPPTVVSQTAKEKKYDQSLMARLWKCLYRTTKDKPQIPFPVVFLNKQYRMHPDICLFPSMYIYNKALETDSATEQSRCASSWPFQPYTLFDVEDGCETKYNESFYNLREVKLVLILIKMILEKQVIKVGVITPYNAQKYRIQRAIEQEMQKEDGKRLQVEVDTVDGFQGREMDCIIVSCVRASSESGSIGFLGNRQRMNVTITRAKYSLFILGHLRTLREQRDWGALIQDAVRRGAIIQTREKSFKTDAKEIFKSGFRRSLSYPPREGAVAHPPKSSADTPAFQRPGNPYPGPSASAGERPVALGAHQVPAPPQPGVATKGRSLAQPPPRPPSSGERPRDPRLAGGQREGQQSSHFSLNRSVSWDNTPPPQHVSRDWGRRESRQTVPCPSQTTQDARKRPSDGHSTSTSTSDKKVKR